MHLPTATELIEARLVGDSVIEAWLQGSRAPLYHHTTVDGLMGMQRTGHIAPDAEYPDFRRGSKEHHDLFDAGGLWFGPTVKYRSSFTRDHRYVLRGLEKGPVRLTFDNDKMRRDGHVTYPAIGGGRVEAEERLEGKFPFKNYLTAIDMTKEGHEELTSHRDAALKYVQSRSQPHSRHQVQYPNFTPFNSSLVDKGWNLNTRATKQAFRSSVLEHTINSQRNGGDSEQRAEARNHVRSTDTKNFNQGLRHHSSILGAYHHEGLHSGIAGDAIRREKGLHPRSRIDKKERDQRLQTVHDFVTSGGLSTPRSTWHPHVVAHFDMYAETLHNEVQEHKKHWERKIKHRVQERMRFVNHANKILKHPLLRVGDLESGSIQKIRFHSNLPVYSQKQNQQRQQQQQPS